MQALQALPKDKKPEKLVVMVTTGRPVTGACRGPPTSHRPSQSIFEEESGIKLEIVGVGADDQFTKIIQDTTTKAGGYDIYSFWLPDKGTLSKPERFASG